MQYKLLQSAPFLATVRPWEGPSHCFCILNIVKVLFKNYPDERHPSFKTITTFPFESRIVHFFSDTCQWIIPHIQMNPWLRITPLWRAWVFRMMVRGVPCTMLSQFEFFRGKFRLLSMRKASCTSYALPPCLIIFWSICQFCLDILRQLWVVLFYLHTESQSGVKIA